MAYRKEYIGTGKEFIRFTEEEMANVRNIDMIDFLGRKEGFSFKKDGSYYRCIEHNSLCIYPDRHKWVWNAQNIMGLNCIDWLKKVDGYSVQEAFKKMIHLETIPETKFIKNDIPKSEEKVKNFIPPQKTDEKYSQAFMYLVKTRCISPDIVNYCFKEHIIYQDTRKNAVFCGYDEKSIMRFAEVKGTNSYAKSFKGNVTESDKRYSFLMRCDESLDRCDKNRVFVFEAPIDLLSHCTLTEISERKKFEKAEKKVDENHLKSCWKLQNRLSLSGTADVALKSYLERYPETTDIVCCLDNDDAGKKGAENIIAKYGEKYNVSVHFTKNAKDYNQALQNYCNAISLPKCQNDNIDNSIDNTSMRSR